MYSSDLDRKLDTEERVKAGTKRDEEWLPLLKSLGIARKSSHPWAERTLRS
jgi:hypothetical protein